MNAVWHTDERSSMTASKDQELATTALRSWAESLGQVDIWRSFNPTMRDYYFFLSQV